MVMMMTTITTITMTLIVIVLLMATNSMIMTVAANVCLIGFITPLGLISYPSHGL